MLKKVCVECKYKWDSEAVGDPCPECGGNGLVLSGSELPPEPVRETVDERPPVEGEHPLIEMVVADKAAEEGEPPVLSIVMPVLNQLPFTKKILEQLGHHTDVPFEVIVVDNGSDDGTQEFLAGRMEEMPVTVTLCKRFAVIRNTGNVGVSRAWNQGCRTAAGEYIAVINNDVLVPDRWASKFVEAFRADSNLWALSPMFTRLTPPQDWEERNLKHMGEPLRWKPVAAPGAAGGFCGFFFLFTRTAWEETGEFTCANRDCRHRWMGESLCPECGDSGVFSVFDERFTYWYNDVDWWYRLQEKGHAAQQLQNVLIHHFESQTLKTIPDLNDKLYREGVLFNAKWGSKGRNDEMAEVRYSTGCVIAIPSRGPIDILHEQHMINLVMRSPIGLSLAVISARGMEIAEARNFLAREAIRGKAKWMLFIDDDTFVPLGVLSRMCLELDNPITTGVVYHKGTPSFPVIFREDDVGPWVNYEPGKVVKIRRAGLACTCIRTEIFEQIEQPWFKSGYKYEDVLGAEHFIKAGEDFYFYDKARAAGIDAYVDTSILCDHYDAITNKWYPSPEQVQELMANNRDAYKGVIQEQTSMGVPPPEERTEVEVRAAEFGSISKQEGEGLLDVCSDLEIAGIELKDLDVAGKEPGNE